MGFMMGHCRGGMQDLAQEMPAAAQQCCQSLCPARLSAHLRVHLAVWMHSLSDCDGVTAAALVARLQVLRCSKRYAVSERTGLTCCVGRATGPQHAAYLACHHMYRQTGRGCPAQAAAQHLPASSWPLSAGAVLLAPRSTRGVSAACRVVAACSTTGERAHSRTPRRMRGGGTPATSSTPAWCAQTTGRAAACAGTPASMHTVGGSRPGPLQDVVV